jgi:hypothetical protein
MHTNLVANETKRTSGEETDNCEASKKETKWATGEGLNPIFYDIRARRNLIPWHLMSPLARTKPVMLA